MPDLAKLLAVRKIICWACEMRQQLGTVARRLTGSSSFYQAGCAQCACSLTTTSFAALPPEAAAVCDVPAGHEKSDMRNSICNISLNRRRDISLRNDVKLYTTDKECVDLRGLLRGDQIADVRQLFRENLSAPLLNADGASRPARLRASCSSFLST